MRPINCSKIKLNRKIILIFHPIRSKRLLNLIVFNLGRLYNFSEYRLPVRPVSIYITKNNKKIYLPSRVLSNPRDDFSKKKKQKNHLLCRVLSILRSVNCALSEEIAAAASSLLFALCPSVDFTLQ